MAKFETKQKSIYKVDLNFIIIEKNYFGKNPGTNQNFIAPVL